MTKTPALVLKKSLKVSTTAAAGPARYLKVKARKKKSSKRKNVTSNNESTNQESIDQTKVNAPLK